MKRFIYTFTFLLVAMMTAHSQIVITEIMYNPPEGGTDSMEYIEIHNAGMDAIDLTGYTLGGVTDTLEGMIAAGAYTVLSLDSGVIARNFGVTSMEWQSGSLRNSGETLRIIDPTGTVVDSVDYDDGGDWPSEADGDGYSLELCDVDADNNLFNNWKISTTETTVIIDGTTVFGSPGAANNVECSVAPPPSDYEPYEIAILSTENEEGVADSLGVKVTVEGTVYGGNLRGSGYDFTIINDDNTAGLKVFTFDSPFDYTVTEGDRVQIKGRIAQFRGLIQIAPDSLTVLSQGNALVEPNVLEMAPGEDNESTLIKIEGADIDSITNVGSSGFNVHLSKSGIGYLMRVDADTGIESDNYDQGMTVTVTGIGGQFADNSAPFDNGYQIQPRYETDIEIVLSTSRIEDENAIKMYPNPVANVMQIETEFDVQQIEVFSILGNRVASFNGNLNSISLGNLNKGMYVLRIRTTEGVFAGEFLKL